MAVLRGKLVLTFFLLAHAFAWAADETATARFTGTVRDPDGKLIAGAKVIIGQTSGARILTSITNRQAGATTGPDGRYELVLEFRPAGKPLRCRLVAERKDFVTTSRSVELEPRDTVMDNFDLTLPPGLVLSGTVRFTFFSERELVASPSLKEMPYVFNVTGKDFQETYSTDKKGAFEVYVPPGEYRLEARFMTQSNLLDGVRAGSTNLLLEPQAFVWSEESVGRVFDEWWEAMDRHYSYFFLKPDVDWTALKQQHRGEVVRATNSVALAKALQAMLAPLRDIHVWIDTPTGRVSTYRSSFQYNGNGRVTRGMLEQTVECGEFAVVGRTRPDGFGYFLMVRQSSATPETVKQAVAAIQALSEAPGFIVDLRQANGGSEPLADEITRLFCAKDTPYAKSKYRIGPGHDDLGREGQRILRASGNPFTKPVVCLIGPGAVSSGEGFVKMMKCLPHVTTVGLPTRGASGNPKPFRLEGTGVSVMFSRWVDLMPNGETFEGKGIPPEVRVDVPASAYIDQDPTLEKGLSVLRERVRGK